VKRVLLDHCVPRRVRLALPDNEVFTAFQRGWSRFKNGRVAADVRRRIFGRNSRAGPPPYVGGYGSETIYSELNRPSSRDGLALRSLAHADFCGPLTQRSDKWPGEDCRGAHANGAPFRGVLRACSGCPAGSSRPPSQRRTQERYSGPNHPFFYYSDRLASVSSIEDTRSRSFRNLAVLRLVLALQPGPSNWAMVKRS